MKCLWKELMNLIGIIQVLWFSMKKTGAVVIREKF
jgi:hypothetical protein